MLNPFARRRSATRAAACVWVDQDPSRRDIGHRTWGGQIVFATEGHSTYKAVRTDAGPIRDLDDRDRLYNGLKGLWQEVKYLLHINKRPQPVLFADITRLLLGHVLGKVR